MKGHCGSNRRCDRSEFSGDLLFESHGQHRVLLLAMVRRFDLRRQSVPDGLEEPSRVRGCRDETRSTSYLSSRGTPVGSVRHYPTQSLSHPFPTVRDRATTGYWKGRT